MNDFEEVTIQGVVTDVRGPLADGTYELDIKQENDETITVNISSEQYAELLSEVEDDGEEEPEPVSTPKHLLN